MRASRPVLALATALLAAAPLRAQTVEYVLPTEYTLIPERLSVTFEEGVSEAQARQVAEEAGAEVVRAEFREGILRARADAAFTDLHRARIEEAPAVRSVAAAPLSDAEGYRLTIWLEPAASRERAEAALAGISGVGVESWQPPTRDLIVAVEDAEEEDRLRTTMERHPLVKYVSYLAEP